MSSILVAIDGTERGARALAWAARYANRDNAQLALVSVIDPAVARTYGADEASAKGSAQAVLDAAKESVLAQYPEADVSTVVVAGKIVEALADATVGHDMIVLGSHHGASAGETVGGAKGLRVSVSVDVPTVVVPCDWDPENDGDRIVVGVGPDDTCHAAIEFGVREALADAEPLELVSGWGLPALLSKPAEAMGGGLGPVGDQFQSNLDALVLELSRSNENLEVTGHAVEGPSPSRVLLDYAKGCKLLVLGTHSRSALGRTLFGSVTHSVLLNLCVPTVVVPQK